jgi:putative endonuclease
MAERHSGHGLPEGDRHGRAVLAEALTPLIPAKAGIYGRRRRGAVAFYVYILASRRNGTLYIGMTDDLSRRVYQHRTGEIAGFTRRYGVKLLVWYDVSDTRSAAFARERQMKEWQRAWKIDLIQRSNPNWSDLYETLNN